MPRHQHGFTLLEIMVVVAIFSVLLSIGFSNYVRARNSTQTRACVKQIRTLQAAKSQLAMIRHLPAGTLVSAADLLTEELIRQEPICPMGFSYDLGTLNDEPVCTSGLPGHTHDGPY